MIKIKGSQSVGKKNIQKINNETEQTDMTMYSLECPLNNKSTRIRP